MKVIKDNDLSILFRPWGYGHRYYLHFTAISGFHLLSPETLLTEQDLWGKLPEVMGENKILDEGMPKIRGEFLVTGKCHAPAGESIRALRVAVSIGSLEKHIHVFGDRHWKRNLAGIPVISDPEPFSEIGLVYGNAFGGPDYEKNPIGIGFHGSLLPNLESPGREIGSPSDSPDPAGFAPLDRMWPQRLVKAGTYDEAWQKTHWPYFPADMDYGFFNMAPADQQLSGFFTGRERFVLEGLHPEHRRIENTLPQFRPRQFVYRKIDPEKGFDEENLVFEEAALKLDTVWFFPEGLLGVLVFHGSVEIQDEEYLDVHRLYLTKEPAGDAPGDLAYYRDRMLALMDMSVPIDMTPFEKAVPEFERMARQWRNIPKQIMEARNRGMGRAPMMSYTPGETAGILKKTIAGGHGVLDGMEQLAREMHAQYGHMAKIDLARFGVWREKLAGMNQRADDMTAQIDALLEQAEAIEKNTAQGLRDRFTPEELAKAGVDPDNLLANDLGAPWQRWAFPFVRQARKNLEENPDAMGRLAALGFERRTVERAWMGIVHETVRVSALELGLDPDEDPVEIPPGLVLPVFREAEVVRVAVRTERDWLDAAGQYVVPASRTDPVFMSAALGENPPVIVAAEQMAALLLEQETGDACGILWLPDGAAEIGEDAEKALENALRILVITGEREVSDGLKQWVAGRDPATCLVVPVPENQETVFAAREKGLKIRPWILGALPEDFARVNDIDIVLPAACGKSKFSLPPNLLPPMDIKGLVDNAIAEIGGFYNGRKSAMEHQMDQALDQAAKNANIPRSELDAVMESARESHTDSPAEVGRRASEQLRNDREGLRGQNRLTPEIDAQYREAIDNIDHMTAEAEEHEARLEEMKIGFAEKKAQFAAKVLPGDGAEKMRTAGLDPDRMRTLTRNEVILMHGRKESLSMYSLSGLDLSGLDLTGVDLSQARCIGTRFSGAILAGARLSGTMANEADFSGVDLTGATAEMAMFTDAVMPGAVFVNVVFKQVTFTGADLAGADFSGASLNLASFENCRADGACFTDARLDLAVFNEVVGKGMNFSRMQGHKCLFQDCVLDDADFSEAVLPACMFMGSRGENVLFTGADLSRASICQESAFPRAGFHHARMHMSCVKESDLSGSDLRKTDMDGTLFEGCDLTGACMRKMVAPRTKFIRVDLEGADMRGVNLMTGSLRRSRLVNADLSHSNLYGADLYKAVFGDTNLEGTDPGLTLLAGNRKAYLD